MEQFENYRNLAYRYLTIRNRSEKEVRDYLARKKAAPEIIEKIITSLIEKKFLNDEAFARSWVLNRARLKPKGKALLKIELRQKGITDEIIQAVLQETAEEIPDEIEQAKRLVSKKLQQLTGRPRQEIYQKAGGFLSRRGYNWETVKKAIDESLKDNK
jgi:regulatory protein